MAINIDINTPATTPAAAQEEEVKKPQDSIKLNARKSLDGNIMIFDHEDMDIVVMPSKKKVITFPKDKSAIEETSYSRHTAFSAHSTTLSIVSIAKYV